ncbi:MAG: UTRA domain-containing protein [Firmicutes bacterium]|nr:UTRA domain-containing protein [Bacillota bacterium]
MSETIRTKKDQILNIARQDPFLKVEEIAAKVETTPRYVRTILSEAKVSLMQLRRSYARRMEERLGIDTGGEGRGHGGASVAVSSRTGRDVNEIRVRKVKQPQWAKRLKVPDDEPLLMVTRVQDVAGEPVFISQVVTTGDLSLSEESLHQGSPLRELLGLMQPEVTEFRERSLEVEPADPDTAAHLGIPRGEPVLRSGRLIVTRGQPVGLEFNIFPAYAVRLVLGEGDDELQVVDKTVDVAGF